jgi:hypothetical protein
MTILLAGAVFLIGSLGHVVSVDAEVRQWPRDVPPFVDEMLTLSGVTRQLAQLPDAVVDGHDRQTPRLDARTAHTRRKILRDAYRLDTLYPIVVATVRERYDEAQAEAVVRALRTPLFRRLQLLEDAAGRSDTAPRIRAFSEQLVDNPPSVERRVLIRRLERAMATSFIQMELLAATLDGLANALGEAAPAGERRREAITDAQEQTMVPAKNQALLTLLFAYQMVADGDLRDYLTFWESAPGRWFVTTVGAGIAQALRTAAETAGRKIKAIKPPTSRRR